MSMHFGPTTIVTYNHYNLDHRPAITGILDGPPKMAAKRECLTADALYEWAGAELNPVRNPITR